MTTVFQAAFFRRSQPIGLVIALACLLASLASPSVFAADAPLERLIDRPAFDLVTLKSGKSIETVLLDFPERKVPNPLPTSGTLKLSRISQPSKELSADWKSIAKIELYEELVLKEAVRLTKKKEFVQAFAFFSFLHKNYSDLPGLEKASQEYLIQDASAAFSNGNSEESLTILAALYQRNPRHRGLTKATPIVSDKLIAKHLSDDNYAAARATLESIRRTFPKLNLRNLDQWQNNFQQAAREKLRAGEEAFRAKNYDEARAGVQAAYDILPDLKAAAELLAKIQKAAPEVRVGVSAWGELEQQGRDLTLEEVRTAGLTDPKLVQMTGFGAEGGDYVCPWGNLKTNDAGIVTTLQLDVVPKGSRVTADAIARSLLAMTDPSQASYSQLISDLLKSISITDGQTVSVAWHRPHIRPEALLQTSLREVTDDTSHRGTWFSPTANSNTDEKRVVRFQRDPSVNVGPSNIVEVQYPNDEAAIAALVSGEVDVIDHVPVWQLERLERVSGVRVEPYRLPTVHVLRLNFENPLLATREFRRALCYAIDREDIVENILLAGAPRSGYQVLSGPFPAGSSLNDPVSYAYKRELLPRPYEPRLASVLSSVARANLAKLEAALRKEKAKEQPSEESEEKPKLPPPQPLVLAYLNSPVAQLTCQTMKLQLDGVGIPVELKELPPLVEDEGVKYDLFYTELAINEPVTEARYLLGPDGLSGHSTAYMNLALDQLDEASNWKEASKRLKEIHGIAHYDLPVIPLWQTVNHFAYRQGLTGVGNKPVTLYQNVNQWNKAIRGIDQ